MIEPEISFGDVWQARQFRRRGELADECGFPNSREIGGPGKGMNPRIKRVYEPSAKEDGKRILVDRLWPRGLSKVKADVDLWLKEIAPSTELRKWFGHDPGKWAEFRKRYWVELEENDEQVVLLKEEIKKGVVTLLYGARDEEHNEAVVLLEFLRGQKK
jgi:uncharacterized protein YeaO (DUF488 family)